MITTTLTKNETLHMIQGPAGELELILSLANENPRKAWGIVCHPHPMFGGTMYNKVVTTLVKAFQNLGVSTARFNFRGVGKSEGRFDQGEGELYDLLAVINWLLDQRADHEIWLGGFSFGAVIAARATTQIPVAKLVTIAPPVENAIMSELPPITSPWILVQGLRDDVVKPQAVLEWAAAREPAPTIIRFPDAGHFFHGQLIELREQIEEALRTV